MKMAAEKYLPGQIKRGCSHRLFAFLFFVIAQLLPSTGNAEEQRRVCYEHQFSEHYAVTGVSDDMVFNVTRGRIIDYSLDVATHGRFARGGAEVIDQTDHAIRVHYWANAKTKLNWHLVVYCTSG